MNEELKVNSEKYKFGKFGGITLISLVITIIVLIILAGVAIYLSLGNNGIFTRAKQAKELTNKQEATEIINLKITTAQMNKYAEKQEMPTLKELSLTLKDDNEIEYVTEDSKVASTEYDVPSENPISIYTKLNKYPYEFEINGELQLASIDGVKLIANKTPENTPPNSQNTMSEEEHFTGEYYYNRKPIYEKTLYINSLPNKTEKYYNHNINEVDIIWVNTAKTFILFPGRVTSPANYCYPNSLDPTIILQAQLKTVKIVTGADRTTISAYITLNYTKTTDLGNEKTISPTPAN